jgi:anthraniloyl-CoA monooxygenase
MTDISREGRITPGCTGLYKPEHVPAWRRIVDFVHRHSRAKIGVQLGHAGRKGATCLLWQGDSEPLPDAQTWPIVAPSPLPYFPHSQVPQIVDRAMMDAIRADYIRSAEMAHEAGFDLIEVHMAHGYLLASFISPLTNQRGDEYGGSIENRARFPLEILRAVRAVWPQHKPLSVRISATDWQPGGISGAETLALAHLLKRAGADLIDVSTGQTTPQSKPAYGRLYQTPFAEQLRLEVGIATMAVGNISSFSDVNSIIAAGRADLAALARAHLFDPYWTQHAAAEQEYPTYWPPQYQSVSRYRARFK